MSVLDKVIAGLRSTVELTHKVEALGKSVEALNNLYRDLDRRLVRVEVVIEIHKPDGSILKIAGPEPR
jgi:hypothetical protein